MLSSSDIHTLIPQKVDRSFSFAAPVEWNNLPAYIRNAQSITIFKSLLKTHLFRLAHETHLIIHEFIHIYARTDLHIYSIYNKHAAHMHSLIHCTAHLNISAWNNCILLRIIIIIINLKVRRKFNEIN